MLSALNAEEMKMIDLERIKEIHPAVDAEIDHWKARALKAEQELKELRLVRAGRRARRRLLALFDRETVV